MDFTQERAQEWDVKIDTGLASLSNRLTEAEIEKLVIRNTGHISIDYDFIIIHNNTTAETFVFPILLKENDIVLGPTYRREPAGILPFTFTDESTMAERARDEASKIIDSMGYVQKSEIIKHKLSAILSYMPELLRRAQETGNQ